MENFLFLLTNMHKADYLKHVLQILQIFSTNATTINTPVSSQKIIFCKA